MKKVAFVSGSLHITLSEILTFPYRGYYFWKRKFDPDVKFKRKIIKKMIFKKVHIKIYRLNKQKDILVMLSFYFLRITKMYYKKWRNPICLFDKSLTQDIIKCLTVFPLISVRPQISTTFGYPHWNKRLPLISASPLL